MFLNRYEWVGRPIHTKTYAKECPRRRFWRSGGLIWRIPVLFRYGMPLCCVQSWRAIDIGRHVLISAGVLHATNGGLQRGMTLRAIHASDAGKAKRALRSAPLPTPHNIACNTLPYVFAQMGLPPLNARAAIAPGPTPWSVKSTTTAPLAACGMFSRRQPGV